MLKIADSSITNPVLPPELGSNPDSVTYIQDKIASAVGLVLVVGALIFFFNLVIGAITWISSGGDKQALESAKGKITHALVGLVILFAVFAIINLIEAFFNIKILRMK